MNEEKVLQLIGKGVVVGVIYILYSLLPEEDKQAIAGMLCGSEVETHGDQL